MRTVTTLSGTTGSIAKLSALAAMKLIAEPPNGETDDDALNEGAANNLPCIVSVLRHTIIACH